MLLTARLVLLSLLAGYALCVLRMHRRGRVRLRFDRQLVDHSGVFAPYNLLMYAFSEVKAQPFIDRRRFPIMDIVQQEWETLREEALCMLTEQHLRASTRHDDASFNSFFRQGWKRFYLKWYGDPLPSAAALCPRSVALLERVPVIRAAMFALLPPGGHLNPHRDPFAGSLRYHLGLITPNSDDCRIFVDGSMYAWRDGEDVVFDETYVHWAENRTDQPRIILFCDLERPLRSQVVRSINRHVSAFMGKITTSPNQGLDRTGGLNRIYAWAHRKSTDKRLAGRPTWLRKRPAKYSFILLALWILLLAPYPFHAH